MRKQHVKLSLKGSSPRLATSPPPRLVTSVHPPRRRTSPSPPAFRCVFPDLRDVQGILRSSQIDRPSRMSRGWDEFGRISLNPYREFGRSQFRAPPTRCRFLRIHPPTSCNVVPIFSPSSLHDAQRSRVFTRTARRLRFRCRLSTPHCACGRFQPRHHAPREAERSGVTKRCDCDLFGWWSARLDVTLDPHMQGLDPHTGNLVVALLGSEVQHTVFVL